MAAHLWREFYVMLSIGVLFRMTSIMITAYPAVLDMGLKSNSSALQATNSDISWIFATISMTGPIGFLIFPPIMQTFGRKTTVILLNVIMITGCLITTFARNIPTLILARAIQGLSFCGFYLVSLIAGEYSHPKRRGFYIVFNGVGAGTGITLFHCLAFYVTWRQAAWIITLPSLLAIILVFFCPESPSWLAYKGRYNDCADAFEFMRGKGSKDELKELIIAQKEIRKLKSNKISLIKSLVTAFKSKEFTKPLLIMVLVVSLAHLTGVYYLPALVIKIMVKLTGDESQIFRYTLIFNLSKLFGIILSSVVVKVISRRSLCFYGSSLVMFNMALICLFDYLRISDIFYYEWILPVLLIFLNGLTYSTTTSLYVLLSGEIFPIDYKSIGSISVGIVYCILGVFTLKSTTLIIATWHLYQIFLFYLITSAIVTIFLYFILPETKDRTLQNIELEFMNMKLDGIEEEMKATESEQLVVKYTN